jgi:hypothetical protein
MGMTMSFHRVTADELDRITANPENVHEYLWVLERGGEPNGYLDRAWDGLRYLFEAAHLGIDLFFDGESLGTDGTLSGWDVELVRLTADRLRSTPFEQLARYFDPERMTAEDVYPNIWHEGTDALDYLHANYENLRRFFDFAATSDSAAIMSFG